MKPPINDRENGTVLSLDTRAASGPQKARRTQHPSVIREARPVSDINEFKRRSHQHNGLASCDVDLTALDDEELSTLINGAIAERSSRFQWSKDSDAIAQRMFQEIHGSGAGPGDPILVGESMVAFGTEVVESSGSKHSCIQFTILIGDGDDEYWPWEADTLLAEQTGRVARTARGAQVHQVVDGMKLIRHKMKWNGEFHERVDCKAWEIVLTDNGPRLVPRYDWVARRLPTPLGEMARGEYRSDTFRQKRRGGR